MTDGFLHCPVAEISGIWRFVREAGQEATVRSTPGHLLHYVVGGFIAMTVNRRSYEIAPGTVIYYHGEEEVRSRFRENTVFYSVAFQAPALPPLAFSRRVFEAGNGVAEQFAALYEVYAGRGPESVLRLFSLLTGLLDRIGFSESGGTGATPRENLWREIESWIREHHKFRASIPEICDEFHLSPATLRRVCRDAAERSVGERIREIRMEEGRALLRYSSLNVSEVARYLGYARIHEFSREFSVWFGRPPSAFRTCRR